jgi:hypothetical protein
MVPIVVSILYLVSIVFSSRFKAELLQEKIRIPLRPWEAPRNAEEGIHAQTSWTSVSFF